MEMVEKFTKRSLGSFLIMKSRFSSEKEMEPWLMRSIPMTKESETGSSSTPAGTSTLNTSSTLSGLKHSSSGLMPMSRIFRAYLSRKGRYHS